MNIHSQYSDKCSYQSFKAIPTTYKVIPEVIGNLGKYVGEYINTPEQKLLLASTALLFQPLIDLKFAEEDKKVDSAIKSASKAMAGGITGVPIRAFFIALANYVVRPKTPNFKPIGGNLYEFFHQSLYPLTNRALRQEDKFTANFRLKQYNKTLGTILAIIFMLVFSNSKLDVPLTGLFQDLLSKVIKDKKPWSTSISEVVSDRKKKFDNWKNKKMNSINNFVDKSKKLIKFIKDDILPKKESGDK